MPSQAAADIVALINSSPHSPRQDQIAAIIAKAMAPQPNASPLLLRVREAIARLDEGFRRTATLHLGAEFDVVQI